MSCLSRCVTRLSFLVLVVLFASLQCFATPSCNPFLDEACVVPVLSQCGIGSASEEYEVLDNAFPKYSVEVAMTDGVDLFSSNFDHIGEPDRLRTILYLSSYGLDCAGEDMAPELDEDVIEYEFDGTLCVEELLGSGPCSTYISVEVECSVPPFSATTICNYEVEVEDDGSFPPGFFVYQTILDLTLTGMGRHSCVLLDDPSAVAIIRDTSYGRKGIVMKIDQLEDATFVGTACAGQNDIYDPLNGLAAYPLESRLDDEATYITQATHENDILYGEKYVADNTTVDLAMAIGIELDEGAEEARWSVHISFIDATYNGGNPLCGNGILEAGEECDTFDFGHDECYNQPPDTLICLRDCTISRQQCPPPPPPSDPSLDDEPEIPEYVLCSDDERCLEFEDSCTIAKCIDGFCEVLFDPACDYATPSGSDDNGEGTEEDSDFFYYESYDADGSDVPSATFYRDFEGTSGGGYGRDMDRPSGLGGVLELGDDEFLRLLDDPDALFDLFFDDAGSAPLGGRKGDNVVNDINVVARGPVDQQQANRLVAVLDVAVQQTQLSNQGLVEGSQSLRLLSESGTNAFLTLQTADGYFRKSLGTSVASEVASDAIAVTENAERRVVEQAAGEGSETVTTSLVTIRVEVFSNPVGKKRAIGGDDDDECARVWWLPEGGSISSSGGSVSAATRQYEADPFSVIDGTQTRQSDVIGISFYESNLVEATVDPTVGIFIAVPLNASNLQDLKTGDQNVECVFWDTERARYSNEGCTFERFGNNAPLDGFGQDLPRCYICRCNHTTDFGALFTGGGGGANGGGESGGQFEGESLVIQIIGYCSLAVALVLIVSLVVIGSHPRVRGHLNGSKRRARTNRMRREERSKSRAELANPVRQDLMDDSSISESVLAV